MAMIESKRGQFRRDGQAHQIESIHVLSGFDPKGPTVGFHVMLKGPSKAVEMPDGQATIEIPTAEAHELAMCLLEYVRVAHEKHGHWLNEL
jgi:hypothetical protein